MKRYSKLFTTLLLALALITAGGCASTQTNQGVGQHINDNVITTNVKAQLFDNPNLRSGEINVETFNGIVQLSGFVSSRANMVRAIEITRNIKGVRSVKNDMRLK